MGQMSSQKGKDPSNEIKSHNRSSRVNGKPVREKVPTEKSGGSFNLDSAHSGLLFEENGTDGASLSGLKDVGNVEQNGSLHTEFKAFTTCYGQPQDAEPEDHGGTLEDLFFKNNFDDEDDDSDWEEPPSRLVLKKWYCLNCTLPNFDDDTQCENCGEQKGSEVRGYDVFERHIRQATRASVDAAMSPTSTVIGFDERMLLHSEPEEKSHPHPERPDRLRSIAASLVAAGIFPSKCSLIPAREITKDELLTVHTADHIETVEQTKNLFYSYFTSDTYANGHSACAARLAAGLCADLASLIVTGQARNGFALVRPPGHHACIKQAMGFCLHNNAAVAALAAQRAGAKKVLIVDWDVHHGNGTQEIFDGNHSVLYISLHRHENGRFYPGTGAADEVGVMDGKGFSVNIPWSCGGVGDNDYIFAFQHVVLPIALEFAPDITIISAGFDAARGDPLGCCDVTPAGYSQMTSMLTACSGGRLLVILEGGYNLRSISSSATEVLKVLIGEEPSIDLNEVMPSEEGRETILQVLEIQQHFWPVLVPKYALLQSKTELELSQNNGMENCTKKRKQSLGPFWWKWGSKRFAYDLLFRGRHAKRSRREKQRTAVHECS